MCHKYLSWQCIRDSAKNWTLKTTMKTQPGNDKTDHTVWEGRREKTLMLGDVRCLLDDTCCVSHCLPLPVTLQACTLRTGYIALCCLLCSSSTLHIQLISSWVRVGSRGIGKFLFETFCIDDLMGCNGEKTDGKMQLWRASHRRANAEEINHLISLH